MKIFTLLMALASVACSYSQSNDTVAVRRVIERMFDGMRKGDSAMVSTCFHPKAGLQSVLRKKSGESMLISESPAEFLKAVGTPHAEIWNEVIHSCEIRIDGIMATAWTPYSFFLGDKFIHCGVNSFTLMKTESGWKIITLTDTRRKEGCK